MLNKSKTLYKTENGKLVAEEVRLLQLVDGKVEMIKALPIPRKKLKEIFKKTKDKAEEEEFDKDIDAEIVLEYCKDPIYTKEELDFIKPTLLKNIAGTIFQMSGLYMGEEEQIKVEKDESQVEVKDE